MCRDVFVCVFRWHQCCCRFSWLWSFVDNEPYKTPIIAHRYITLFSVQRKSEVVKNLEKCPCQNTFDCQMILILLWLMSINMLICMFLCMSYTRSFDFDVISMVVVFVQWQVSEPCSSIISNSMSKALFGVTSYTWCHWWSHDDGLAGSVVI